MTETINLICFHCKHWQPIKLGCLAFPDGIPDKILRTNKHDKVFKEQKNRLVYEFDPKSEERSKI